MADFSHLLNDPGFVQQLMQLRQNGEHQLAINNNIHNLRMQSHIDTTAKMAMDHFRMFGPESLTNVANSYLHEAGQEGKQHLLAASQRLIEQGQGEAATALHSALDGW